MADDSMDDIHWDVGFALKKMAEQLQAGQLRRLIISADRNIFDLTGLRDYLQRTEIKNFAWLHDIYSKAEQILDWHNHAFENLHPAAAGVGHSFNLPNGGFLQISSPIECIAIYGKEVVMSSSTQAAYDRFFSEHPVFKLYSNQEFAYACSSLLNILSAYYPHLADRTVDNPGVRTAGNSNFAGTIPSMTPEERFISMLYHKTEHASRRDYPPEVIAKLTGIPPKDVRGLVTRLKGQGWVDPSQGFGDGVAITPQGMVAGHDLLMRYKVIVIRFTAAGHVTRTSVAEYRIHFDYQVIGPDRQKTEHTVTAVISDVAGASWGVPFGEGQPGEGLLLLHAKDYIRKKLEEGSLQPHEEMVILTRDLAGLPVYTAADTVSIQQAEFLVIPPLPVPAPEHTSEELATWIIKTREVINMLSNKKHKIDLFLQPDIKNLLDLHKEALNEDAFYSRVISIGTVVGSLNIDGLRTLTSPPDNQTRSVSLLDLLLKTLTPDTDAMIKPMRKLTVLRNASAHKDSIEAVEAYRSFGVDFPVTDYAGSWRLLLKGYWMALEKVKALLMDKWV